ncbi:MAG: hypothetical protein JOZ60_14205 [Verrucomicrobia bacterium]|nr:hypothetical protein [Verrucomicrobiota bacterium]
MRYARFHRFWPALPGTIWVLIGLILCGVWCAHAQEAADVYSGSPGQVIFTQRAIRHIEERHWPDSPAQGAGKFAPGITEDSLRELVTEAVANGQVRQNTHGRPGKIYEYAFSHAIGVTIDGNPAHRLRVVVNQRNRLVTAFPF